MNEVAADPEFPLGPGLLPTLSGVKIKLRDHF